MLNRTKQCFVDQEINTGRQDELDIVKGLAIIFMIWCHAYVDLGGDPTTSIGFLVDSVLGGPFSAPIFMICMGIGICYSRNNTPSELAKRGLLLFGMGYFLNICRYTIPTMITYLISGAVSYLDTLISDFFVVDILQFAGLSFLVIAVIKKLKVPMWVVLLLASMFSVAGTLLVDHSTGINILDYLLGIFWKTNEDSYFPFFHWFAFPVIGLILGKYLRRCRDKRFIYKMSFILFPIAAILEIAIYFLGYGLASDTVGYYYMNPVNIFFCVALAVAWAGIWFFLHEKFQFVKIGYLQKLSKHINNVYCIHWVMIGFVGVIMDILLGERFITMLPATIIASVFLFSSEWLTNWYIKK